MNEVILALIKPLGTCQVPKYASLAFFKNQMIINNPLS